MASDLPTEEHDILIIGAGLTGINAAHRLRTQLPHRNFTILESKSIIGGTWSFWKYPGIRSDSSLRTFGFAWYPWKHSHKVASAQEICTYMEEAAKADGTLDVIKFRHRVLGCDWNSKAQQWFLEVDADGVRKLYTANFVFSCTGYYSYEKALESPVPGIENFSGTTVHPQWWPQDLDYSNKNIVVIGSGATAITIVPVMAETAQKITMLQRSPSYVASIPRSSALENFMMTMLPLAWVHWLGSWIDMSYEVFITELMLTFPRLGRYLVTSEMKAKIPKKIDASVHFNPAYGPFQQRLCLTPDEEFFKALGRDNCEVVTDVIETVTENGILLKSGRELPADVIVTATGLYVQLFGGLTPKVDGKPVDIGECYVWRGCLLDGVPNAASIIGYTTSTWTPGADVMTKTVIKVIKQMESQGATSVAPVIERTKDMLRKPAVDAKSNYFVKAVDRIPKATGKGPWYGRISLIVDYWALWFGSFTDGLHYTVGGDTRKTR